MSLGILILLCIRIAITGAAESGLSIGEIEPASGLNAISPSRHELGREIYNFRCYYCHGYAGDAVTLASSYLTPRPRNFRSVEAKALSREAMIAAVTTGREGTAMKPFSQTLSAEEIRLVVDFVRHEFIESGRQNTRYHTRENGWGDHQRYRMAFPFATGEIALDTPWSELTAEQRAGKRLYMDACISCHDRARVTDEGAVWEAQAVSYPRLGFRTGDFLLAPDEISAASPFARHDIPRTVTTLTERQREGERLFQGNCAFCHGADGTGKNWIGTFLEPHARDLTSEEVMANMTSRRLYKIISEGITGTAMPAWRQVMTPAQIEAVIAYIDRVFHRLADTRKVQASTAN